MKEFIGFGKIYVNVSVQLFRNKWKSKKSISSHFKYLVGFVEYMLDQIYSIW